MIIDNYLGSGDTGDNDQPPSPNRSDSPSSQILGRTPQGPLPFNSGAPPSSSSPPPPHSPATPPSLATPPSPATPTDALSISDPSTGSSAIQTIQTYLASQAQAIQSHLTGVLPGLIQGEVRIQCTQLAQEIGAQISSIREEVNRPFENQDDLMLTFIDEGQTEGSRGRDKRSTRCSRDKGGRFATESDNEAAESSRHHHHSQQPNNGDEADNEEEGESDEEEISAGSRKYRKQLQALRVSVTITALHNED